MRSDSDEQRRKGTMLVLNGNVDCPACGCVYDGTWTDSSLSLEDMAEPPVAVQACPQCGTQTVETWPGWVFRSEAG